MVLSASVAAKVHPRERSDEEVEAKKALAALFLTSDLAAAFQPPSSRRAVVRGATAAAIAASLSPHASALANEFRNDPNVRSDISEDGGLRPGVGAYRNYLSEYQVIPEQVAAADKIDFNNAPIGEYRLLPGMFPKIAGIIASDGPYKKQQDVLKLDRLTSADKALVKKYMSQDKFVAMPPGRMFYERINGRTST